MAIPVPSVAICSWWLTAGQVFFYQFTVGDIPAGASIADEATVRSILGPSETLYQWVLPSLSAMRYSDQ